MFLTIGASDYVVTPDAKAELEKALRAAKSGGWVALPAGMESRRLVTVDAPEPLDWAGEPADPGSFFTSHDIGPDAEIVTAPAFVVDAR